MIRSPIGDMMDGDYSSNTPNNALGQHHNLDGKQNNNHAAMHDFLAKSPLVAQAQSHSRDYKHKTQSSNQSSSMQQNNAANVQEM